MIDWGFTPHIYIFLSLSLSLSECISYEGQDFTACTLHLNVSWFIISGRAGGVGGGGGEGEGRNFYRDGNFVRICISTTPIGAPIYIFPPGGNTPLFHH